jgi:hypothetical protein
MADLLALDLTDFNVREKPQTRALLEQKLMSLEPVAMWWYEHLIEHSDEGKLPDFIGTSEILEQVEKIAGSRAYHKSRAADVIRAMAAMCPSATKHQKGDKWDLARGLRLPTLAVAQQEFEAWIGGEIDWQEDAE